MEIELEKTYLLKYVPNDLNEYPFKEYLDIYFPTLAFHPTTRIRKRGNEYEITKKYAVNPGDASKQYEFTISLTRDEFNELNESIKGKRSRKLRYFYKYRDIPAEIDFYQDKLQGLIIVDFEFKDEQSKNDFEMPEFCLVEVTQDNNLAGGMLVGKSFEEIKPILDKYNYKPVIL